MMGAAKAEVNRKVVTFDQLPDYGILLGRTQIARLEVTGKFPKRVQLSEARIGWLECEIIAYVEARR